jgi:exonuclease SbcC
VRPLTLMLKNFGPYIDEVIDFTCFEDSSLFLISGKTGAGKTTIFDGMSYALFGESSGKLRLGKEMRSTFADPSEPTEVTLVFAHGEFRYEITRKPEQELLKKKGSGVRKQPAKISLIVKDGKGKEIRAYSKSREVDNVIQELLHLNASQFAQIVLLPQGEFRTFLIANSSDKEKVLRNLFGTQLYQTFAEGLKEQLKTVNQAIQEVQQTMQLKRQQLFWLEEPTEAPIPEMLDQLSQQQQVMQQQQADLKQQLTTLKNEKQQKEQILQTIEEQAQLQKQKTALLAEQEQQKEQAAAITVLKETEQQLRWAQQHQVLLNQVEEKRSLVHQNQQEIETNTQLISENQTALTSWQLSQEEHRQQQAAIATAQTQLQTITYQLPLYEQFEQVQKDQQQIQQQVAKEQQEQTLLETKQVELQAQKVDLEQTNQAETVLEKDLLKLTITNEQWQHFLEDWQELTVSAEKISQSKRQLKQFLVQLTDEQKRLQTLQNTLAQQKSHWAALQIQRLSLLLVAGEPCPVCGSLEHPKQQEHQEITLETIEAAEADLKTGEAAVQRQESQVIQIQAQMSQLEHTITELAQAYAAQQEEIDIAIKHFADVIEQETITEATPAVIEQITAALAKKEKQLQTQFTQIQAQQQQLTDITKELEQQAQLFDAQKVKTDQLNQQLTNLTVQLQTLQQQLADPKLSVQQLKQTQQQLTQQVTAWQNQQAQLETTGKTLHEEQLLLESTGQRLANEREKQLIHLKELEAQLTTILLEKAIDEVTLENWLKQTNKLTDIKNQVDTFEKQQQQLYVQLAEIEKKISQDPLAETTLVQAELQELQATIERTESQFYQGQEKITMNETIFKEIKASLKQMEAQYDEVTALQQLTDAVNGNNPQKISLERYVLQTYLEQVLTVANQRLGLLTNNRYQFELNRSAGSYKNQTGLEINIYDDNSGSVRSAHTLSGGESFIAALALALSLAEVIQEQAGGVMIEALFIDEGFGSLDEEALEMAIEALETIENEGRMIGIISHVGELKARIPQQLQIQTNGNGQSHVRYQFV